MSELCYDTRSIILAKDGNMKRNKSEINQGATLPVAKGSEGVTRPIMVPKKWHSHSYICPIAMYFLPILC